MTAKVAPFVIGSDTPSAEPGSAGVRREAMRVGRICLPWLPATPSPPGAVATDACQSALP
jgi:hypothetical protein